MINVKTLVTTDQIDDTEDLEHMTEEQILDDYGCPECGDINWERYSYKDDCVLHLEELRCATCKTPYFEDTYEPE